MGMVFLLLVGGCESLSYYAQSVNGHLSLMAERTDIDSLLSDLDTDASLREKLARVHAIREFASAELGLPDNDSYRTYVDVGSAYVVWNVVAAPEFSLQPETWCFLVVGCLSYRGYYQRSAADNFAEPYRERGYDVYVGGSQAYSTLGWFDDPLLSTMLGHTEAQLAAVVFHELAHQVLYIDDDTAFNEAFAVVIEREGVARWLVQHSDQGALEAFTVSQARNRHFIEILLAGRSRLKILYEEDLPPAVMRERKRSILASVKEHYEASDAGEEYAGWFHTEINNAKLALVATYWVWVPAFQHILGEHGGDLESFYAAVEQLSLHPASERHAYLDSLTVRRLSQLRLVPR